MESSLDLIATHLDSTSFHRPTTRPFGEFKRRLALGSGPPGNACSQSNTVMR
jgi:hypothetical protein